MEANQDPAGDALRRTRLANERTYLAWWRTGLSTFVVSLAACKLVPELSSCPACPYEVIALEFGIVGVLMIAYAYVRQQQVEEALERGEYAPLDARAGLFFAAIGVLLGLGTIVVIFVQSAS